MAPKTSTFDALPGELEAVLTRHLPRSLPLLRRLQFEQHNRSAEGTRSRIVFVSDTGEASAKGGGQGAVAFTAAHVDFASGTLVVYSTLEDPDDEDFTGVAASLSAYYEGQVRMLVDEVVRLVAEYAAEQEQQEERGEGDEEQEEEHEREARVARLFPRGLVLGTLNTRVRDILLGMDGGGRIAPRPTGFYDKWLFAVAGMPRDLGEELPPGMRWCAATVDDCALVVSRTHIPRTPEMLVRLPSLVIRLDDGTPISWAFIGQDGSLISLHCEEPYRRRGLAKALAAKLLRRGPGPFASDGWCSADVAADNVASRRMCRSLGGRPHWEVSWVEFDVTKHGRLPNSTRAE
ncbi:hypothetical protein N3K66_004202 [Trichothecium roseum]|uniref:Uncharacterized protein n=1 Tax=Trichothecium roseum TaxID=47278 RepID=A0ACC0V0L9_9HYPO|nr:hypothetical protein N3K66_004202 [Trichothecium roseum]